MRSKIVNTKNILHILFLTLSLLFPPRLTLSNEIPTRPSVVLSCLSRPFPAFPYPSWHSSPPSQISLNMPQALKLPEVSALWSSSPELPLTGILLTEFPLGHESLIMIT